MGRALIGGAGDSGSLAMLAAMRRDRHCWLGALTCAKLGRFVEGDASEPTISLHRVLRRITRPRSTRFAGPFFQWW